MIFYLSKSSCYYFFWCTRTWPTSFLGPPTLINTHSIGQPHNPRHLPNMATHILPLVKYGNLHTHYLPDVAPTHMTLTKHGNSTPPSLSSPLWLSISLSPSLNRNSLSPSHAAAVGRSSASYCSPATPANRRPPPADHRPPPADRRLQPLLAARLPAPRRPLPTARLRQQPVARRPPASCLPLRSQPASATALAPF